MEISHHLEPGSSRSSTSPSTQCEGVDYPIQPDRAARRVCERLEPGGSRMIVESKAGDTVADNLNPVGRLCYGGSTYLHARL